MKIVQIIDDLSSIVFVSSTNEFFTVKKSKIQYLKVFNGVVHLYADGIAFFLVFSEITNPETTSEAALRDAIDQMCDKPETVREATVVSMMKVLNFALQDSNNALTVRGVLAAKDSDGVYRTLKTTPEGNLSITISEIERLDSGFSFVSTLLRTSQPAPENIILLRNPAGSGKNIKFSGFEIYFNSSSFVTWEVYRNPTVTNQGNELSSFNANGGSGVAAVGKVYDGSVVSALGERIRVFVLDINNKSNKDPYQIVLAPGQDVLLRRLNVGVNVDLRVTFQWTEEVVVA